MIGKSKQENLSSSNGSQKIIYLRPAKLQKKDYCFSITEWNSIDFLKKSIKERIEKINKILGIDLIKESSLPTRNFNTNAPFIS